MEEILGNNKSSNDKIHLWNSMAQRNSSCSLKPWCASSFSKLTGQLGIFARCHFGLVCMTCCLEPLMQNSPSKLRTSNYSEPLWPAGIGPNIYIACHMATLSSGAIVLAMPVGFTLNTSCYTVLLCSTTHFSIPLAYFNKEIYLKFVFRHLYAAFLSSI